MLRIIAGKYKGKKLSPILETSIRPTKEIAKEALFSMLESDKYNISGKKLLRGSKVLDIFAGSGALAIEAISRGASKALLIENNAENIEVARKNIRSIDEVSNITILGIDATNLPNSKEKYNLVFIDPPYKENLIQKTLSLLVTKNWLEESAIIVCEMESSETLKEIEGYKILEERKYGKSKFVVLKN